MKKVFAVFESTPFYGESGGQVGDQGRVFSKDFDAEVIDVQKPVPELIVAQLKVKKGTIKVGESYTQETNAAIRAFTARNHTATHLLHWALHEVLGDHVKQAGSLVEPDLLRFDFTHFQQMTQKEVTQVEDLINEKIWNDDPVQNEEMSKDAALKRGAIAFFGEKYGDQVRVVTVGDYSVELCGGTHIQRSSEINLFKIVSESSVASGVRRIVAYTSQKAFQYLRARDQKVLEVRDLVKASSVDEVSVKVEKLISNEKALRKQTEKLQSQSLGSEIDNLVKGAKKNRRNTSHYA